MTPGDSLRVYRGDCWDGYPQLARGACRNGSTSGLHDGSLGLRLVVGPLSGDYRVNRGGSWFSLPRVARVAYRGRGLPGYRGGDFGLRLVVGGTP